MKTLVIDLLCSHIRSLSGTLRVLELGLGDGELLELLVARFPGVEFVAVDVKPALIDYVRDRLGGNARAVFVEQDLSADEWDAVGGQFDVIYSMQSFHDLGGKEVLEATYRRCLERLKPGGMLLNADFVEPMPQDDPHKPRRFPANEHLRILRSLGFVGATLHEQLGMLGCMTARSPGGRPGPEE